MSGRWSALVLAGSRGEDDPVAKAAGVSHKAIAPIAGWPMIEWPVAALSKCPDIGPITIMIEDPHVLDSCAGLMKLRDAGRLSIVRARESPVASAMAGLQALRPPVLITTADHALLTKEMVAAFLSNLPRGADIAAGAARREVLEAAWPESARTYLRFSGQQISGCNLFAATSSRADGVIRLWRQVEQNRKHPWKLIRMLGLMMILRYVLGRLTLKAALERLGQLAGCQAAIVDMPMAEAAIDVDKPADMDLVEKILKARNYETL